MNWTRRESQLHSGLAIGLGGAWAKLDGAVKADGHASAVGCVSADGPTKRLLGRALYWAVS